MKTGERKGVNGREKWTEMGFENLTRLGFGAGFPEGFCSDPRARFARGSERRERSERQERSSAPNALGASRGDLVVLTGSVGRGAFSDRGLMQRPRQVRLSTQPVAVSPVMFTIWQWCRRRPRVLTGTGSVELAVPRDGEGRFEPQLIEKWARRLPGFDEKVISLYARGMTTREIRAQVEELCGVTVSRELISKVTGEVHEELREWRSRPLEAVYPIVYFDALRVKVREEGVVQNQAVHLATGVTALGRKEILGMWTAAQEGASGGAKFWLGVMNELKAPGAFGMC